MPVHIDALYWDRHAHTVGVCGIYTRAYRRVRTRTDMLDTHTQRAMDEIKTCAPVGVYLPGATKSSPHNPKP